MGGEKRKKRVKEREIVSVREERKREIESEWEYNERVFLMCRVKQSFSIPSCICTNVIQCKLCVTAEA